VIFSAVISLKTLVRLSPATAALPALFQIDALLFTVEARPADVVRAIVRADGLDDVTAFPLATLAPDGSILNCFRHLFILRIL
jgi:hypothetical protein